MSKLNYIGNFYNDIISRQFSLPTPRTMKLMDVDVSKMLERMFLFGFINIWLNLAAYNNKHL